jgi:phosphomevalonate kinase
MLKFLSKTHPKKRYVYAITGGVYLGELFVFMKQTDSEYSFLSLPDMKIRSVPFEKFDFGLKEKIIDIVQKLPKNVYDTCLKQYNKNSVIS